MSKCLCPFQEMYVAQKIFGLENDFLWKVGNKDDVWGATIIKAMKYMFANDKKVSHFSQEGGVDYPKFGG